MKLWGKEIRMSLLITLLPRSREPLRQNSLGKIFKRKMKWCSSRLLQRYPHFTCIMLIIISNRSLGTLVKRSKTMRISLITIRENASQFTKYSRLPLK